MVSKWRIKKLIGMTAAFALSVSLCACQNPTGATESSQATEDSQQQEVSENIENNTEDASNMDVAETEEVSANAEENNGEENDVKILHPMIYSKRKNSSRPGSWRNGATCEYNTIALSEEEAKEYPRLAKALVQYTAEKENQAQDSFYNMRDIMAEDFTGLDPDTDEDTLPEFEDHSKRKVVRSDSVALSVFTDYYSYYGGAHPYYSYSGYNFDSQTGHILACEDVVKDVDKLNEILFDRLMEEYGKECDLEEETVKEHLAACKSGESEYEWLLGYEGVTFYFNPYCLTSFAGGMQIVHLRFDEYPDIFNDTYQQIPNNYIEPFCGYDDICIDLNQDGKVDKISATSEYTENIYNELYVYININDETYTFNYLDSFEGELYLVHKDGNNYVYHFAQGMGYGQIIQCYDVSDATAKRVHRYCIGECVYLGGEYEDHTEGSAEKEVSIYESMDVKEAFVDPNQFRMQFWMDSISTVSGVTECKIAEDGLPDKISEDFNVSKDWLIYQTEYDAALTFTTKTELTMKVIEADGREGDEIALPKGTKLLYKRTDNKTYADFELKDGKMVRAELNCIDYPTKISGVELEEALDGTMFAG